MGNKVFIFDHNKCNGCYNCQIACKDEHCGNEWLPFARPQQMTGAYWMKLMESTEGQVPKVRNAYRPVPCQHCGDAPCLASDAFYRREDGLVILDPAKAGDKALLELCPYGTIYWNPELQLAQKCTGCAHLIDAGELPHCVDACTLGALRFGDEEEFAGETADAELFMPELGTAPNVYYLNMPHLFAAGDVWDPDANEVVCGAKVVLSTDGNKWETETDEFGDFWFRKIDAGEYHLSITAEGFKGVEQDFSLEKSRNLGDFPLSK